MMLNMWVPRPTCQSHFEFLIDHDFVQKNPSGLVKSIKPNQKFLLGPIISEVKCLVQVITFSGRQENDLSVSS